LHGFGVQQHSEVFLMRIVHIITRMIVGGAQENTLLCCQDLMRLYGDEVLLVTGPALGPEGDLLTETPEHGVPVELVGSLRREIHPWRDVVAYRQIRRILSRFRPDVVHTHSAKAGVLGRSAAWALAVPAIVHTVHGAPFHPYQPGWVRALFRQCERYAARRCHRLISVADAMTQLLVEAHVAPREKFVTIYSGMDVQPFLQANQKRLETRTALGFGDQHVVIGKIARLFQLKGHADVVEAAAAVIRRFPHVRFLFVGDGVLRPDIERQIARAGLTPYFVFTGLVPPSRIADLIGAMDILVHASLREGLARALPQALLAGKPVVSYDIDGAREVVIPGQTGYLIRPGDVQGLVEALSTLVGNERLRQGLGEQGRSLCRQRFDHVAMTAAIRREYQRLLPQGPHSGQTGDMDMRETFAKRTC